MASSTGPYEIADINIHTINEVFRLIQSEIDKLHGLTDDATIRIGTHTHAGTSGADDGGPVTITGSDLTAGSSKITLSGTPTGALLEAVTIDADESAMDHGTLSGIGDDDHSVYPLVSNFEADRATIATNWTDLTDGGATTLHSHAAGGNSTPDVWTHVDGCITAQPWELLMAGENVTLTEIAGGNCLEISASAPSLPPGANGLITGGAVVWTGGLDFTVGAATYRINGVDYSSPLTNITLDAADGSNDRLDAIIVNSSNTATFITGTPATNPSSPSIDPTSQLLLTIVLVKANATTPGNVTVEDIYLEDTEWTTSTSLSSPASAIDTSDATDPFAGSVDIKVSAAPGSYVEFDSGGTVDLTQYNTLNFLIKNISAWAHNKNVSIVWLTSGGSATGAVVTLDDGIFGFSDSNTTDYQLISIDLADFAVSGSIGKLRITISGGGGGVTEFYLDNITLQGGASTITLPTGIMIYKGDWSSSVTYNENDVVVYNNSLYVATDSSAASTPSFSSSYWRPVAQFDQIEHASASTQIWEKLIAGSNITLTEVGNGESVVIDATGGGVSDHGGLTGLSDDDHTQYILHTTFTADGDVIYRNNGGTTTPLAIGNPGDVLTVSSDPSGSLPSWSPLGTVSGAQDNANVDAETQTEIWERVLAGSGISITEVAGGNAIQVSGTAYDQMPCWWKVATIANLQSLSTTMGAGDFTVGIEFQVGSASLTCTGGRFDWLGGEGAQTVRLKLWQRSSNYYVLATANYSSTPMGSVDVSVNAAGLYTGSWDEGDQTLEPFKCYAITSYYISGSKYIKMNAADWEATFLSSQNWGGLRIKGVRCYGAGDNQPSSFDSATYVPIEAIFTEMGN